VKRILAPLVTLLLLALVVSAHAQGVRFEPRAIVVNPAPAFGVSVSLDKPGSTPTYAVGERISISVRSDRDAYVYLYSLQPDGSVTQILPNRFDDENYLRGGETRTYPPRDAGYVFNVEAPTGLSRVVAVASLRPLDTRQLARFESGAAFATSDLGQSGFQSAFRIVVEPIPNSSWVTSTAYYDVVRGGGGGNVPAEATLAIDSEPRGADVYLDGRFVGTTPLRVGSQPGRRTLRIEAPDYYAYQTTLQLSPGESRRIDARLEAIPRTGTLVVRANVGGAQLFLDGRSVGTIPSGSGILRLPQLDVGEVELTLVAPGYETVVTRVTVRAGEVREVRLDQRRR
jgi:hypothetical protein